MEAPNLRIHLLLMFMHRNKWFAVSFCLVIASTGCSTDDTFMGDKISKSESCREATRLIGKTTDQLLNPTTKAEYSGKTTINLIGVAQEFRNLSFNTDNKELSLILIRISDALKKLSNDETFFEGNSMYLAEIASITRVCS